MTETDHLDQPLFNNAPDMGFGYHNVAQIFERSSDPSLVEYIGSNYGQRCGHLPDTPNVGILVSKVNPVIESQVRYLSDIIGENIQLASLSQLGDQHRDALVVPYINTSTTESFFANQGMKVWGLPGRMVDAFKNKADCHLLIAEAAVPGFNLPDFAIINIDHLDKTALSYVQKIHEGYQQTSMGCYPVGIMLRGAESDGNYGGCYLKEEHKQVALVPNGMAKEKVLYPDWETALTQAKDYLSSTVTNADAEARVVASRFIDLEDSPGLSVLIQNGRFYPLGWNGQIKEEGDSACTGTQSYHGKSDLAKEFQNNFEGQSSEAFEQFIRFTCRKLGIDINSILGVTNVDLMIPGPMEIEFQRRLGQQAQITIAELNPRFTNWTDAILYTIGAQRQPKTLRSILGAMDQGISTSDHYPIPDNVDHNQARDRIRELDSRLRYHGTRILVRMLGKGSVGLVFVGDVESAKKQLDLTFQNSFK